MSLNSSPNIDNGGWHAKFLSMDVPKVFVSLIQGITIWEMPIPVPLPEHFGIMHKQGIYFNLGTKDNGLCMQKHNVD